MKKISLLDIEETKDKIIGIESLLEVLSLSEVLEDKYCCALNILQNNLRDVSSTLDTIKYEISQEALS